MTNCGNKTKHTCAEKNYATCIHYEESIPTFSDLYGEDCVTVEETIDDLYTLLTEVKAEINLSALGDDCITTYTETEGKVLVKDAILKLEEELCNLKAEVEILKTTAICDINITDCGLIGLPSDSCNSANTVSTLGQLLQYLITNTPTP